MWLNKKKVRQFWYVTKLLLSSQKHHFLICKWEIWVPSKSICWKMQRKKNNTWDSNVVPHRSTNQARRCLTSLSRREAVLSTWYGRSWKGFDCITKKRKDCLLSAGTYFCTHVHPCDCPASLWSVVCWWHLLTWAQKSTLLCWERNIRGERVRNRPQTVRTTDHRRGELTSPFYLQLYYVVALQPQIAV